MICLSRIRHEIDIPPAGIIIVFHWTDITLLLIINLRSEQTDKV